jgi:hypothetical protein
MFDTYRVVGIDPGIVNMAVSIMDIKVPAEELHKFKRLKHEPQGFNVKVIKTGLLKNPMFEINKDVVVQNRLFSQEIARIIEKYRPTMLCAERFQNRGFRAGGIQIEVVNLMLGAIASMPHFDQEVELKLVSPIVWKAAIKRQFDLKAYYKLCRFPVHEFDSTLIGMYGALVHLKMKPFANMTLDPDGLLRQIEEVTMSRLKTKRIKKEVAE